jgi:hypothetical protein
LVFSGLSALLRHILPPRSASALQDLPKVAILTFGLLIGTGNAHAQGGPNLGPPQNGETILNRDIDVRTAPDEGSRVVMSLPKGKTVMAFGTPRRTTWTQIGLRGRDIGYVPSDSLDPIFVAREISGRAAVVSRIRWAPDGTLRGTHVVTEAVKSTERRKGKQSEVKLERGQVLGLLDVQGRQANMSSESMASVAVPVNALIPIIGVHDYDFGKGGTARSFYILRVGDYLTPVESENAWADFVTAAGPQYAGQTRFIFPLIGPQGLSFALAFGPHDRAGANNACVALAQRMLDCWLIEIQAF